jgi:hypothetical protein
LVVMARRSRENFPEQWHHVYGRGVAGRTVFEDGIDRAAFFEVLQKQVMLGRIVVFAYVLMTNHYHLLLKSPTGELDLAMRDMLRDYVLFFNPRHGRDGPLFKSRYGSKPVGTMDGQRRVLGYIDRNPVSAGMVGRAIDYAHGSAYHFHRGTAPSWLNTSWAASVLEQSCGVVGMPVGSYGTGAVQSAEFERESDQLVEARMQCVGTVDPLDRALESLEEKGRFLDEYFRARRLGVDRLDREMPVAAIDTVLRVCRQMEAAAGGGWLERTKFGYQNIWDTATAGVLVRMAGCSAESAGKPLRMGKRSVDRRLVEHEDRLVGDSEYEARVHVIAWEVLWGSGGC